MKLSQLKSIIKEEIANVRAEQSSPSAVNENEFDKMVKIQSENPPAKPKKTVWPQIKRLKDILSGSKYLKSKNVLIELQRDGSLLVQGQETEHGHPSEVNMSINFNDQFYEITGLTSENMPQHTKNSIHRDEKSVMNVIYIAVENDY